MTTRFTQWTYDGVGHAFAWDKVDLRATTHETLDGNDVLLGLSFNNPTGKWAHTEGPVFQYG